VTVKEARWHMSGIMGCHGFFDAKQEESLKTIYDALENVKDIVYCKDCKKRNFAGYCTVHQKNVHGLAAKFWQPEDDYFCADGERKTDGNNA